MRFVARPRYAFFLLLVLATLPAFGVTYTVTHTGDSGSGSLRQALQSGADRIEFAIGTGPQTIQPLTNLPHVSHAVVIDGRTQPGYGGTPIVELDGSLIAGTWSTVEGLSLSNGEVYGLVVNNFVGAGIKIYHGIVRNCYLGTDVTGTVAKPNAFGIRALGSSGVTIGGTGANDGNLISGNSRGIDAYGVISIQGNTFGTDPTQTTLLRDVGQHISVQYSSGYVRIGDEAPNVFAGGEMGVSVFYSNNVFIQRNYFGITPAGLEMPIRTAIELYQASENLVYANFIRGNGLGVLVSGSSLRNRILGNSMEGNTFGIDLSDNYPYGRLTPNDAGDGDVGPNNLMNFPVLGRITTEGGQTTVRGTLNTVAHRKVRIEIFTSFTCHASGHGEGREGIDGFEVTADASGTIAFERTVPALPPDSVLTATATSELEGTSEFSQCAFIEGPGVFAFQSASASVQEGQSIVVAVTRALGALGAASVSYGVTGGTAAGADFTGAGGTLDFADGETSKTFTVQTTGDTDYEGNETIAVALSNATNGAAIGAPSTMTITITDDDPAPAVTMISARVNEGNAGTTVVDVPILLSRAASAPVTVTYNVYSFSATPNVDYVPVNSGTITFAAGETEKRIPVTVIGDTIFESDDILYVAGQFPHSALATVTIVNDDAPPTVSMQELRVVEGNGRRTVYAMLGADVPVSGSVFVTLVGGSAQAGTDFESRSEYLYFSNQTVRPFEIAVLGDDEPEPDEQFFVRLQWSSYGITAGPNGIVTIVNDDVGVGPAERSIPTGAKASYTVHLGGAVTEDTVIPISSNAPSGVSVPASLLIPAGQSFADFEVTALAPGHNADITLTFPPSAGGTTRTVRAFTYAPATLRFSPSRLNVAEGKTATVSVSFDPPKTTAATIGLRSTDRVSVPSSLTIPAGGSASFVVTAKKIGAFTVDGQLPVENGNEVQSLYGDVIAPPTAPAILSLTPSHGPTSGGTEVTIGGANLRNGCTLSFGGVAAPSVQFVSASSMKATTPAHAGGSVDVVLTCGEDSFTFRGGFGYVNETPRVSGASPSTGTIAGGTHVRVGGAHFDGSCWLFFGRFAATHVVVRDAESITGVTPPNAPGAIDVTVRCSGGTSTVPLAFTYRGDDDPAPLLTEVVPAAAAPGELVTIRGLNFRPTDSATIDTAAAAIVDPSPGAHVIRVPELPAGRTSVFVRDVLGHSTTGGPLFSVLEARPPRITAVSPSRVPAGAELELTGEGFRPGYTFEIGGRAATLVSSDYTRAIVRMSAAVDAGSHPVNVRNRADALAAIGPNVEIIDGGLVVTAADPRCTTTDGGVFATIRGRGFTPAARVTFDGVPSPEVVFVDATMLRVQVPGGSAGDACIAVTDGLASATLTNGFTYASPFDPRGCGGRARTVRH